MTDDGGNLPSWATKVLIGTAVIATAAVLTVATAGTGTALACFAIGALKGSAIGAALGAASGAATGAVTHRVTTGSWDGAGQAALEGAADGYMGGAISGFFSGGFTSNACFVAGTSVLTAMGSVAIEDIQAGDLVWAWDEETGDTALKEVVETYVNTTNGLVHVFVDGEEIVTTPSHPFYSPVKGWTEAVHLHAGDILQLVNGEYVVVEKVQHEILETPVTVYNFQVEDYHTYYVSDAGVLVHNVCKNPGGRHGGRAHRNKIAELRNQYSKNGYNVSLSESRVYIPGTNRYRYPDLVVSKNGVTTYIQVGKATKSGTAIAREIRAMADLRKTGNLVSFVAYN